MKIETWSDIACPWCYIGSARLKAALETFEHADEVEVTYRSFQLDPTLPDAYDGTETDYLASRKGIPASQVRQMFDRVRAAAAPDGLALDLGAVKVANSRRAHRLLHAALRADDTAAVQRALVDGLFRAHFVDGESIADEQVLVRCAVEAGLDEEAARAALDDEELDRAVDADIASAAQLGIQGVPFSVVAEKYGVSGAQPVEALSKMLNQVWTETHPQPAPIMNLIPGAAGGAACGPDGCD